MVWLEEEKIAAGVLKRWRLSAGLTQEAFAKRVKTHQETISKIEKGHRHINLGELILFLGHLDKTLSDLDKDMRRSRVQLAAETGKGYRPRRRASAPSKKRRPAAKARTKKRRR